MYTQLAENIDAKGLLLGAQLNEFTAHTSLVNLKHGETRTTNLGRHAILYRGDTDYGIELNALKLIMLIDYVQKLAREY